MLAADSAVAGAGAAAAAAGLWMCWSAAYTVAVAEVGGTADGSVGESPEVEKGFLRTTPEVLVFLPFRLVDEFRGSGVKSRDFLRFLGISCVSRCFPQGTAEQ